MSCTGAPSWWQEAALHRSHSDHREVTQPPLSSHPRCASKELGFQALAMDTRLRSPAEPPTVFIDLRPTKPSDQGPSERYREQ